MPAPIAILPIKDVPEELIRVLNDRFRSIASSSQDAAGIKPGLFFLAQNIPDANSTPVGTFGAETDTGRLLQVQTVASTQTWVQVGGASLSPQHTESSSQVTLTTSYQDVPGLSITLPSAGTWWITAIFRFTMNGVTDIGQALFGILNVDGTDSPAAQSARAIYVGTTNTAEAMTPQQWIYSPTVAGKVIKMRVKKGGGTGASILDFDSTFVAVKVS